MALGGEHGSLTWDMDMDGTQEEEGLVGLEVGDCVEMVPSHIDPTVNLFDWYYAYRDGVVVDVWHVDARGMVQ